MHESTRPWKFSLLAVSAAIISTLASSATAVELDRGVAPHHPQQPQVAVDHQGHVHVAYGVGNHVRYCRSDDGGKSFTQPVDLPATHEISLGMLRGPRIAASEKAICITVIGGMQGKGRDGDLLAIRSADGGRTWLEPVQVNDATDSAREGLHAMCVGPKGNMCCVWLDLRSGHTEVLASHSTDGGLTWSKNTLVYKSPDGSVCECCHPSVTIGDRGRIHVQWRNSLGGARDIYVASSEDGGRTFGAATKLGIGSWPLDACPMDGGAIAPLGGDKFASAWRRETGVFLFIAGERKERRLGTGEQPWITATAEGPFIVWLKKRGDVAYLLMPNKASPIELARHAVDPVIATRPDGRGPVVAAWETRDGKNCSVQCQIVADR